MCAVGQPSARRAGRLACGMQNYDSLKRIGRGNYGTVFLARDVRNGKYYCLKQVQMETYSEEEKLAAQQEVEVLRTLDHPGIVRYREHFLHSDSLCVVMAYCEGGDLAAAIKRRAKAEKRFTEAEVLDWFVQLVMALHHVHSKRILHRDLKTQNIFITKNLVKLGDFGIAKVMEGSMSAASTVIGARPARQNPRPPRQSRRPRVQHGRARPRRHAVLHVARGLPEPAVLVQERRLGARLHPVRDVRAAAGVERLQSARPRVQDRAGEVPPPLRPLL